MLQIFRKNKNSIGAFIVIGMCTVLMAGFGINPFDHAPKQQVLASIQGKEIPVSDFRKELERTSALYRRQFGQAFDSFRKQFDLPRQVLNRMIEEQAVDSFIQQAKLSASTQQIEKRILALPIFNGNYNEATFKNYLRSVGLTEYGLEEALRKEIVREELSKMISDLTWFGDREIKSAFLQSNKSYTIKTASIQANALESKITVTDDALRSYYDLNGKDYEVPDQVSLRFVRLNPEIFHQAVPISEQDLADLYAEEESRFAVPAELQLRKIFLKLTDDQKPSEVEKLFNLEKKSDQDTDQVEQSAVKPIDKLRDRAKKIVEQLRNGKDFVETVLAESSDSADKNNQGLLPFSTYEALDKTTLKAVEELIAGEISEPVETKEGISIYKVEAIKAKRQKSIEEVKPELTLKLQEREAPLYLQIEADKLLTAWLKDPEQKLEDFIQAKANSDQRLKSLKVISSAGLVSEKTRASEIPAELLEATLNLRAGDKKKLELGAAVYFVEILETKDRFIPELAEVRTQVEAAYRKEQSKKLAEQEARDLIAKLKNAKTENLANLFQTQASQQGFTLDSQTEVSRNKEGQGIWANTKLRDAVFSLSATNPLSSKPTILADAYYVLFLEREIAADQAQFAEQAKTLREAAQTASNSQVSGLMTASLRADLNVVVDEKMLGQYSK